MFTYAYKFIFKGLFDFVIAFTGLLLISPVLGVVWLLLILANGGAGAFFTQTRPGKDGCLFKVIKFKTMNDKKDKHGNLLPDSERITAVGSFVRSLSIDEIPQLVNVLKGDMSIVGPRPLLVEYLPLYSSEQARRHEVRPGITGWAQVNGRNAISWEQKFKYDVWYVDHITFILDMKILLMTFLKVSRREGISSGTSATMKPFGGNE